MKELSVVAVIIEGKVIHMDLKRVQSSEFKTRAHLRVYRCANLRVLAVRSRCTDVCPTARTGRVENVPPTTAVQNVCLTLGSGFKLSESSVKHNT